MSCPIEGCNSEAPPRGTFSGLCNRHYMRRKRYGMDIEAINLAEGVTHCQACGIDFAEHLGQTETDHDHENGHVRGILCSSCNSAEGHIRDREHAARLMTYIERTRNPTFDWAADRLQWLAARGASDPS